MPRGPRWREAGRSNRARSSPRLRGLTLAQGPEAVGQTPEKPAVPRDEGLIGGTQAREEPRELGKGRGKRGESDHGEEKVSGVNVGAEEAARLSLAHLAHALLESGPALRIPVHRVLRAPEGLPFHEADPIAVAAGGVEPEGEALRSVVRRRHGPRRALTHLAGEDLAEQTFLVPEVVVEHPLVDARPAGDAVDAGAREALLGELPQGRREDALPRARGMPRDVVRTGAGPQERNRSHVFVTS